MCRNHGMACARRTPAWTIGGLPGSDASPKERSRHTSLLQPTGLTLAKRRALEWPPLDAPPKSTGGVRLLPAAPIPGCRESDTPILAVPVCCAAGLSFLHMPRVNHHRRGQSRCRAGVSRSISRRGTSAGSRIRKSNVIFQHCKATAPPPVKPLRDLRARAARS